MVHLFSQRDDYLVVKYDLGIGSKKEVNKCDLAVVCVPTPMSDDGSCNTSIVEEVVAWLKTPLIMIKSTIPPGTTKNLKKRYHKRIVMSPEYYGQSRYYQPKDWGVLEWKYMIVGGDEKDCEEVFEVFAPIFGPTKSYFATDETTAEMVKYMENVQGATKVTLFNEFYEICKVFEVNFYEARELWAQDPRIDRNHSLIFVKERGFGGKCFPKDLLALIRASENAGYEPLLLKEVLESNKRFRQKSKK
jgi:UDPglucose 6-dehydrogenase